MVAFLEDGQSRAYCLVSQPSGDKTTQFGHLAQCTWLALKCQTLQREYVCIQ
jgi:hypothetical protein